MRANLRRNAALAAHLLLGATLLLPAAGGAEGSQTLEPVPMADGGSCPAADPAASMDQTEAIARLAAQLREAEAQSGGDVVVLNGRGYRYESDRVPGLARDLQQLQIELQRAKAAARQQQP